MSLDETAFASESERYRPELRVHCYRMLGSYEESEDLVQETLLRAWRKRAGFENRGPASLKAWLYRIATNACLDVLARKPRRVLASQLGPPADPTAPGLPPADLPWMQPYPDRLLEGVAPADDAPEAVAVARETMEITFLATLQLLPPQQRAVLILRDVLHWSAKETAALLETSVAAVNSALQRAHATLKQHLPARRVDWTSPADPTADERVVLRRFMEAFERADVTAVAELLAEDVRGNMPPYPFWFEGRDDNITAMSVGFDPDSEHYMGEWRTIETGANLQPAAGFYLRSPGEDVFRAFAVDLLRVEDGRVTEITAFVSDVFPAFGLPATL